MIDDDEPIHLGEPIWPKFVAIPCIHRHPNIFCVLHGCNCPGNAVQNYPECPKLKEKIRVGTTLF